MARAKGWTCQRQSQGKACKFHNKPGTRKCGSCGKPRPPKRKPMHMEALEMDYQGFILLSGGERCSICKRPRSAKRKLDRDHDHRTHKPRGLLCSRCNRALPNWITPEWCDQAAAYLRRCNNS